MFDQNDATAILGAILNDAAYTTVVATHIRLGTNAPTATSNMAELSGSGYTTGGSSISWNTASAAATSNSTSVSWTNAGSSWSLVGLEIWDTAGTPLRHLFGTWTGQPITVANGNTFQMAIAGCAVSLALRRVIFRLPYASESSGRKGRTEVTIRTEEVTLSA